MSNGVISSIIHNWYTLLIRLRLFSVHERYCCQELAVIASYCKHQNLKGSERIGLSAVNLYVMRNFNKAFLCLFVPGYALVRPLLVFNVYASVSRGLCFVHSRNS